MASINRESKRRRTAKTADSVGGSGADGVSSSSSSSHNITITKRSIIKSDTVVHKEKLTFHSEEDEIDHRDPQDDLNLHANACTEIKKMMNEVRQLKSSGKPDIKGIIDEKRIHACLQFVLLKKLNRISHLRCKKVREQTSEAKQKIDMYHLQLQNLLYEAMHLEKEINKCLEFKSKDEEVDLISVEEFYQEAPPEIAKAEKTKNDIHLQTLARLDWELEQRKRLAAQLKEAVDTKETISKDIKAKQEYLDSLQPKLNTILESTAPVQETLGMPFDEQQNQQKMAQHLPTPLYVLYVQLTGYREAYDTKLSVTIEGDIEEAKTLNQGTPDIEEESDSDQEAEEEKRKSKRRRRALESRMAEKRQKIVSKHPLSVILQLTVNNSSSLKLSFYYLTVLKIVTVKPCIVLGDDESISSIAAGDLLSPDLLLDCLYSGDHGNSSPNPANHFQLTRLGMEKFQTYIERTGRPYLWAQWLAGLQFLPGSENTMTQMDVSASHMDKTIKKLRSRIRTRLALKKRIASLERGNVSVSQEYQALFPTKLNARVVSFKRSTYQDFMECLYTGHLLSSGLAQEYDMYFVASVERGSAHLTAQIVVNPDYPNHAPLFALQLHWKSDKDGRNDEHIRMMEAELNVHYSELIKPKTCDELLTNQMQRLLMCLDVYLEAESSDEMAVSPVEFTREKILPRLTRGPDRSKPYCFIPQLGFFSQR